MSGEKVTAERQLKKLVDEIRATEAREIVEWIEAHFPYIHVEIPKWIRQRHAQPVVTRASPQFSTPHGAKVAESVEAWRQNAPKTATEANIVAERDKQYVRAIVNEVLEDRLESSKSTVREIVREEIRARTSELRPMIEQLNTIVQLLSKMP